MSREFLCDVCGRVIAQGARWLVHEDGDGHTLAMMSWPTEHRAIEEFNLGVKLHERTHNGDSARNVVAHLARQSRALA